MTRKLRLRSRTARTVPDGQDFWGGINGKRGGGGKKEDVVNRVPRKGGVVGSTHPCKEIYFRVRMLRGKKDEKITTKKHKHTDVHCGYRKSNYYHRSRGEIPRNVRGEKGKRERVYRWKWKEKTAARAPISNLIGNAPEKNYNEGYQVVWGIEGTKGDLLPAIFHSNYLPQMI